MSIPTVTYLDSAGRALMIRLAAIYNGIEFEDKRVEFDAFMTIKNDYPFKALPGLTLNGENFGQSIAIANYFAGHGDLIPTDIEDRLVYDMVMLAAEDMWPFYKIAEEEDRKKFEQNILHRNLAVFERFISKSGSGFVCKKGMTTADFAILQVLNFTTAKMVTGMNCSIVNGYPLVKAAMEKIVAHEKFAAYFAAHPQEAHFCDAE